ncbi:MAG: T9SS type A sorting domain-containing protein [Flavobacterium sp.]|nr:T9SS type A sorting domain-containing protein [Flavobacterium sp.]
MKKITFLILFFCFTIQISFSQNISSYVFSQSNSLYNEISGGTVLGNILADDERFTDPSIPLGSAAYTGVGYPIGFNFTFNGLVYDRFGLNTNGWIALGSSLLTPSVDLNTTTSYVPLNSINTVVSNTLVARISVLGRDLQSQTGGSIRFEVQGTAPNRVLTIQWKNFRKYTSTGDSYNFQIKLNETSNVINLVYGTFLNDVNATTVQCGLRANPNTPATNYNSRTTITDWTVSSNSIYSNDTMALSSSVYPISGLTYTFSPPLPCSGTPNPGNTFSTNSSVCSGSNFTLSLQNTVSGSGVTYQWQSSANGLVYSNVSGEISNNFYTSQTNTTFYRCAVTCSGSAETVFSNPIQIALNPLSQCYCTPTYSTGKTEGDLISNIDIVGTTLSNFTGVDPVNPSYTFFTGQSNYTGSLQAGSSYNVNITVGSFGNQNIAAWIDYNDDAIFSTSERVGFTTTAINSNGTATFIITLSCNPSLGSHVIRLRDVYGIPGNLIDPCNNYIYGETEDYLITITAPVSCPQPSNLSSNSITGTTATLTWNVGCAETSWDLNLNIAGGGIPTGTPNYPNVTSPFGVTGLNPETNYEFYVRANCNSNGYSLWSGPYVFKTSPLNDECNESVHLITGSDFFTNPITGNNISATNSNPPAPGCASFSGGDVWYKITIPDSGNLTIETNSSNGSAIVDTGMAVYSGTCSNLNLVACDDDSSTDGNFSLMNLINRIPGEVLFVNVWDNGNINSGKFQISAFDCPSQTAQPTGNTTQVFCNSATINDLNVNGTSIKWYDAQTGGNLLPANTSLVSNSIYYASQTINCESYHRLGVTAIISSNPSTNDATLSNPDDNSDGVVAFELTSANAIIYNQPSATFSYYVDFFDADNGVNSILNPTSFMNSTNPQTVYARVENAPSCYNIAQIFLNVTPMLEINTFDLKGLTYYPNPIKDLLNIKYSHNITKVQIFNITGQELLTDNINTTQAQIDLSRFTSGTYLLKISSGDFVKSVKIIKE